MKGLRKIATALMMVATLFTNAQCEKTHSFEEENEPTQMGKTLVAYYSYTGDCRTIVNTLKKQISADVIEIQPSEKGLKYEANNYAIGTRLLNSIKANPDNASSYPGIDPVDVSLDKYDDIIIVTPLWWSQMSAIMQTFLFNYGKQMSGKRVRLIVSSHSSSINGVVSDAKRLIPDAVWNGDALWINNSNRSQTSALLEKWLGTQNSQSTSQNMKMYISIGGTTHGVSLVDNKATQELLKKLQNGPITVTLDSSGGFEIWGSLGFSLPTSNEQIEAKPGDVILYNGSNICIFYGSNSWSYTRLGHIDDLSESELKSFLKAGESNISVTLSLNETAGISMVRQDDENGVYYSINGQRVNNPSRGVFIKNGKKIIHV